jgi:Protein of unknown function (DUF1670)
MGIRYSPGSYPYQTSDRKTFKSALCHLLHVEFPGIFGPTISRLFAEKIDELYERFHPPRSKFKAGQVLWTGVAIDDPPSRNKRIEDTRLVPVVLDLVTAQDIEKIKAKGMRSQARLDKIVRLFHQAHEQGAVLGHADASLLLNMTVSRISTHVLGHERATGKLIPRRGTIHDMGRSVTHKAIICYKSLVEKKPTSQVAQETFHSPEDVEHYVQCFRRIQLCRDKGLSPEEIAHATGHSLSLVQEYLDLITEFRIPSLADPERKEGSRSTKNGNRDDASRGPGGGNEPPVAGTKPAKSCTDASRTKG